MKIVIHSLTFPPRVGGLENIMAGLAYQWGKLGHQVTVFTEVPDSVKSAEALPYKVRRNESNCMLWRAVRQSDVFVEANISLKTCWIGVLNRRKWFVIHHLTYASNWQGKIKNQLTRFSNNVSVSKYVANALKGKSAVIANFYSNDFVNVDRVAKKKDIVFVGRLVSDKGADDLINALILLKKQGLIFSSTIIGEGLEGENLKGLVERAGLKESVDFKGVLTGKALVDELSLHYTMVVPSKWAEPFGIVVLEGLACSCRIVCSSNGGLPEAANGFGRLYPNHDVEALAAKIKESLSDGAYSANEMNALMDYLKTRSLSAIADEYIRIFGKNIIV